MLVDILCSPRAAATFSMFRNKILGYQTQPAASGDRVAPITDAHGPLTIAPPKLRQLHTKTAVMARISKLLTKPLPSARLTQSRRVPYLTLHGDCTSTRRVPYLTPHGDCTSARAHSAGTVTQPSPDIPHSPERSPTLTTLRQRRQRMTCAAQRLLPPCLPRTPQR
jgi:hypothetical protein